MEKTYWGSPTEDFWCCHGSLVQAHSAHGASAYFEDEEGLIIAQYIPTELRWEWHGVPVRVTLTDDLQLDKPQRPESLAFDVAVEAEQPVEFTLKIRLPWWLRCAPNIVVNGTPEETELEPASYWSTRRSWQQDRIHVELPKGLTTSPLPDRPDVMAFMDGPVVLAGLCDEERALCGDGDHPETMLVPDNEREWRAWRPGYRTRNQERGVRFLPLYEIVDERYTVYFPVEAE